jgi:hypothetical protein
MLFPLGILSNGSEHASVGKAAAQDATQSVSDFLVRGRGLYVQHRLRRQDHATQAKSALSRSFVNECLLDWMRLLRCAETFQGRDFVLTRCLKGHDARAHHLAAYDHSAGAALSHSTAESRAAQPKLVVENEEERRFWINRQGVLTAVHFQGDLLHGTARSFIAS